MRESTKNTIDNYVNKGWDPGGHITAVLANDLMRAFGSADPVSRQEMFEVTSYLYNDVPSSCHGSYEIVQQWLESKAQQDGTEV